MPKLEAGIGIPHGENIEIKGPTAQLVEILSKNTNVLRLETREVAGMGDIQTKLDADIGFVNKEEMDRAKETLALMGATVEEAQLEHETEEGEQVLHAEGNNVLHIELTMKPHIKDLLTKAGIEFSEEKTQSKKVRLVGKELGTVSSGDVA